MQNKVTLIFHIGQELLQNSHQNITGAVQESDGNSCAMTAAKLLINRFGSVDITQTSLNSQNFHEVVNWEVYHSAEDSFRNVKELELQKNPWFYVWTHFFSAAPIWEIEEHTYYIVELTDKDLNFFLLFNRRNLNKNNPIERVILEKQHLKIKKTVVFLNVKDFDHGRYHAPKMYIDTVGLFNGIYRRKQERWLTYNVTQGFYPNDEILKQATSIIIPGSTSSAYDDKPWIRQLENFIIKIYEQYTHIKIMGICFGFQLLAKAFGGSVTPCSNRIKHKGFYYFGNETIQLQNELFEIDCFKDLTQLDNIIINKAHGDIVTNLPDMLISYGSSKTAQNEIFMSRDNRIFGMQSHPEYSSQQILLFISALKAQEEKKQFKEFYNNENLKYFVREKGDTFGLILCHKFIKD